MTDLKQQIALTALNNMFHRGHVDICAVREVGELLGVNPRESAAYKMLAPLHCIDFARLPQSVREAVPGLIEECLGVAPTFQFKTIQPGRILEVAPEPKPIRNLLRLFGK